MPRESFSYRSADSTTLTGYQWPVVDDQPVVAAVVLVHDHVADGTAAIDLLEPRLDLVGDLDLSAFNAPFQPGRTEFDWLTRDDAAVDAYIRDPMCGFSIDIKSTRAMFNGAQRLAEPTQLARMPPDLPLYLAVGAKDPVHADLALLWPLVDRYRDAGLHDVTVRVYQDARHEIFSETNRAQVIDDLTTWLQRISAFSELCDAEPGTIAQSTTIRNVP